MHWLISLLLAGLLLPLAGCTGEREATPSVDAELIEPAPFSIDAPAWEPGFNWTYASSGGSSSLLEVEGHSTLPDRSGFLMTVTQHAGNDTYVWAGVDHPGRMSIERVNFQGTWAELCAGKNPTISDFNGKAQALLQFPLHAYKQWTVTKNYGSLQIVQWFQVGEKETLVVPAGEFEVVPIEVRTWWSSSDETTKAEYEKGGLGEAAARSRAPDGLIHYAPDAKAIVRLEASASSGIPSDSPYFTNFGPKNNTVLEMTSYALQSKAPLDIAAVARKDNADRCVGVDKYTAEQAARDETYRRDRLPAPFVDFSPRKTTLDMPGRLSWSALASEGEITWQIFEADSETVVAAGTGSAFSYDFTDTGAYRLEVEAHGESSYAGTANGWVVVNYAAQVTENCFPATVDSGGFTGAHGAPEVGGCPPLPIPVGPGTARLEVTATPRLGDAVAPCPYLALIAPSGVEREWVFGSKLGDAFLTDMIHGEGKDRGTWLAEWHPAVAVASTVTYDVTLEYIAPGNGFAFGGPGSPGC